MHVRLALWLLLRGLLGQHVYLLAMSLLGCSLLGLQLERVSSGTHDHNQGFSWLQRGGVVGQGHSVGLVK